MLQFPFPAFDLTNVDRTTADGEILRRFAKPRVITWRRNGDLTEIKRTITTENRFVLSAPVGAGKSTVIPGVIASVTGALVIHTVPFGLAAQAIHDYMSRKQPGSTTFVDDVVSELPATGVVLMSNTMLLARILSERRQRCFADSTILYMDESHTSDAATAVLREVAHASGPRTKAKFACVITATATAQPGETLDPKPLGVREFVKYPYEKPVTWNALSDGKPWSASGFDGNVLIQMDDASVRSRLCSAYTNYGYTAFSLDTRTTWEEYCKVRDALADPRGGIVVVLCTYAYRSSFTLLGISRIIECGEVGVWGVKSQLPYMYTRDVLDFEYQQWAGRAGRVAGERTTVFVPSRTMGRNFIDVENLEGQAAILLFRLLGYRPLLAYASIGPLDGQVPKDIVGALQGDTPLSLIPSEALEDWVRPDAVVPAVGEIGTLRPMITVRAGVHPSRVSCHTILESPMVASSREAMPFDAKDRVASASVMYRRTNLSEDNLSVLQEDSEHMAYMRPKRRARRFLDAEAAAEVETIASDDTLSVDGSVSAARYVSDKELPSVPVGASVGNSGAPRGRGLPMLDTRDVVRAFGVQHQTEVGDSVTRYRLTDDQLGQYYFYHGMTAAADYSPIFMGGYDSVVRFCAEPHAYAQAATMASSDRLYAVRVLVDRMNSSTAFCIAVHRFVTELMNRTPEQLDMIVSRDVMRATVQRFADQVTAANSEIRMIRDYLVCFQDYALEQIGDFTRAENVIMERLSTAFGTVEISRDVAGVVEYKRIMDDAPVSRHAGVTRGVGTVFRRALQPAG